jgi:hypothetical protein
MSTPIDQINGWQREEKSTGGGFYRCPRFTQCAKCSAWRNCNMARKDFAQQSTHPRLGDGLCRHITQSVTVARHSAKLTH